MRFFLTLLVLALALGACSTPEETYGPWEQRPTNDASGTKAIAWLHDDGTLSISTAYTIDARRFRQPSSADVKIGTVAADKVQIRYAGHEFYVSPDQPLLLGIQEAQVHMVRLTGEASAELRRLTSAKAGNDMRRL